MIVDGKNSLLALAVVTAVDVGGSGAAGVAAKQADAVVAVVVERGCGGAGQFDAFVALAEGVVAELGGFVAARAPGDFGAMEVG